MANKIRNMGMSMEEILAEDETSEMGIAGGNPTNEEYTQAFDEMFEESNKALKTMMEVWKK